MHLASQPNMESFNDRAQEMVTEESEFQIWKYCQSQGFFFRYFGNLTQEVVMQWVISYLKPLDVKAKQRSK